MQDFFVKTVNTKVSIITGLTMALVISPMALLKAFPSTIAQANVCFMVDSEGNTIDLGSLCQSGALDDRIRIPIKRRDGGIPVIEVTFNNNYTYEMLLDTGASLTLITKQMADELGLSNDGNARFGLFQMADGANVELQVSRIESVSVSQAIVNDVDVAIAEHTPIGLLGQNFFGRYDLRILEDEIEFLRRES